MILVGGSMGLAVGWTAADRIGDAYKAGLVSRQPRPAAIPDEPLPDPDPAQDAYGYTLARSARFVQIRSCYSLRPTLRRGCLRRVREVILGDDSSPPTLEH